MEIEVEDPEEFLAHYGVKGMKWGVRRKRGADGRVSGKEVKAARKELRNVGKAARGAKKASRKAKTPEERKAAADKYKKEVNEKIRSKEFKKTWETANQMTRGEKAAQLVLLGPVGALNIRSMNKMYDNARTHGLAMERAAASSVLKELRNA